MPFLHEKWLNYLNFCEKKKYRSEVLKFKPDYLFHIGAFTDLEYCEKNKEETIETNTNSAIKKQTRTAQPETLRHSKQKILGNTVAICARNFTAETVSAK